MVREGYGTSGEGNGTTVGHPKMGAGEVLPLLARDPNYSSVPGSDAEPRLSDAGSGNDGPKKAARGRASLHGEVLLANKTLKKKPYKSLGWSLIAVRALANPPLSCGFSSDTDVTARTQHSGFEPPDRSETPTFLSIAPMPSARAAAPSLCAGKHFTIGVTNSQMKSLRCKSSGQKWWIMLKKSPLICDPSWSWSVMSITLPYLVHSKHRMYQVLISCCPPQVLQLSSPAWQSVSVRLKFFRGDAER